MALGSNQAAPRTHCNRSLPVRAQEGAAAFAYSSSRRRSSPFHWLTVMLVIAAYATWRLNWIDVSARPIPLSFAFPCPPRRRSWFTLRPDGCFGRDQTMSLWQLCFDYRCRSNRNVLGDG